MWYNIYNLYNKVSKNLEENNVFKLGLKEMTVVSVKPGLIRKDIHEVTIASSTGKRMNVRYDEQAMAELTERLGLSAPEELKGRSVVTNDKKQIAYLPEHAELTIAVRSADGKLTEIDFR